MHNRMTEGSPLKLILMFAMPVLLGNVFQQFYNMADTMIVGRILGVDALAAMGATASVSGLVLGLNIGLAQGFAIPIAQYVGAGEMDKVRKAVAGTLMLGLIFVIGITVIALVTGIPVLKLLGTPEEIMGMSIEYIFIIYGGLIITMMYNMAASILRSYGDSRTPLYFLILASLTNIVLDYVFLKTLHMGVGGAAIATLISQGLSVVLCVLYIKEKTRFLIPEKEDFQWDREMLKAQLSLGVSMGLMNSIVSIGSVILQSAVNKLGAVIIAGHTASRKVIEMFMQPLISIGVTATTYVSQNLGANKLERIRKGLHCCTAISFVWSTFCILISFWGIDFILALVVDAKEVQVIATARQYFKINVFFFYALSVLFIYRNALQGLGKSQAPIFSSCIEMIVKILATLLLTPSLGYLGVCYTEPIAWILMAVFLLAAFYRDPRFILGKKR